MPANILIMVNLPKSTFIVSSEEIPKTLRGDALNTDFRRMNATSNSSNHFEAPALLRPGPFKSS